MHMERDAGFYSGSSENGDEFQRDDPRSPTDASDDSVDVKLTPIVIPKNKRKSLEPSRVVVETDYPLKKRIKFEPLTTIKSEPFDQNPFRPWASVTDSESNTVGPQPNPAAVFARHPAVTTLHRIPEKPTAAPSVADVQDQPLALLKKRNTTTPSIPTEYDSSAVKVDACSPFHTAYPPGGNAYRPPLLPPTPAPESNHQHDDDDDDDDINPAEAFMSLMASAAAAGELPGGGTNSSDDSFGSHNKTSNHQHHRNYKNMTRERRIEANARERTRVHTISAAFDTLRKSIPSYSQSQKLSKLSVLRVACSYILTLSRIAGDDYSPDHSEPSVNECTDEVSRTIQTEGKIRKKKDEQ